MKKTMKKTYAIILVLIMLMNYFTIVVNAVTEADMDPSYEYAILKLDSTSKEYRSEDDIYIDVKITKTNLFSISDVTDFKGRVIYDNSILEFQQFEMINCRNGGSDTDNKVFQVNSYNETTKRFKLNDTILRLKFKALEAPVNTQTTIKLVETEVTTSEGTSCLEVDDAVNTPEITLTLNKQVDMMAHNIKMTKTDSEGNVIENNKALFKITTSQGEEIFEQTGNDGIIQLSNLERSKEGGSSSYKFEEILSPTGYNKNAEATTLFVEFDDVGKITNVTPTNGTCTVDEATNTIDLKITNVLTPPALEKEVFNIVLNKVDEQNNSIITDTAEFEFIMPDGTRETYATGDNGKTENIAILAPETEGTYTYLIKEKKAPEGYIIEESNIILELTYEKQGNKMILAGGKIVSYNNEPITINNETVRTATINIVNEKPLSTYNYTINIDKIDEQNNNITTSSAVFEISSGDEKEYLVTNAEGKASYNFTKTNKEIEANNTYTYTLKEIKAPDGYILDETAKTVRVSFNNDGTINTVNVNGNNIRHTQNEINIEVANVKEQGEIAPVPQDFDLVVNKVDEEGTKITAETKYTLTLPDGTQVEYVTTGTNDKIPAPEKAGTYVYVLTETTTPSGYIKGEDIILKLTFEEIDGKIVLVSGNNGVNVTGEETKVATIDVPTKEIEQTYSYELNIEKVKNDTFKSKITEDIAIFEITANGKTTYAKTNALGRATYEFSKTSKEIAENNQYEITITEVKAPNGYKLDKTTKTLKLTLNSDGTIKIAETSGNNIEKINNTTNEVNVRVINENEQPEEEAPTTQEFKLAINKVDESGNKITAETKYTLTLPNGAQVDYSTTKTNSNLPGPEKAGTYVYVLTETTTPSGYIKGEDIILKLTFEEIDGKIVLVSGNNGVEVTKEDIKVATINVETEKETVTYNYSINIDKVNTEGQNIQSADTEFELIAEGKIYKLKANEQGKIVYEFTKTNKDLIPREDYIYTLKETKAPNGYTLDETEKTITINFNGNGSINNVSVSGEKIQKVSNTTNAVNVKITNEKEKVTVPQDFKLIINKVDEQNNLITTDTANFTLTKTNGETVTISTENGVSSTITLNAPTVAGKQIYLLEETKAPNGYEILNKSLVIEANFVESEGKIILSTAKVKEYNQEITPSENTLSINVVNKKHEEEKEPEKYAIKISGVDENGNLIENGTTVVKLTNKETGVYEYKEVQIKEGIIEIEMPIVEGTSQYELEQIKAPDGYKVNSVPAQIDITFIKDENEKITISDYVVTGEGTHKGTTDNEGEVSIIITNEKIKQEPQKENYLIEINKIDSVTKELITEGSAIFTVIDQNGVTKEYGTTDGTLVIRDIAPGNVGESHTFVIKEKTAPTGYKLPDETIIVKVEFEEIEGKIVAKEPQLIMGSTISTIQKNENEILININNEKEGLEVEKQKYSITINKFDYRSEEIIEEGTAVFEVVNPNGAVSEFSTTNGVLEINDIETGNEGETVVYVIKEKVAPQGYKPLNETIILKVTFGKRENKTFVSNVSLEKASNYVKIAGEKCTENHVELNVLNIAKEKLYVVSKKYRKDTYEFYDEYLGKLNEKYPIYQEEEDVYQVLDYFYGVLGDKGKMNGKLLKPLAYTLDRPFIDTKIAKFDNRNVFVEEFIGNLESNGHMVVLDKAGNILGPKDIVETGMILKSTLDDQELTFDIVVKGDGYKTTNEKKAGRVNTADKNAITNIIVGNTEYVKDPLHLRALDMDMDGRLNTSDKAEITELLTYTEDNDGALPYYAKWSNSNVLSDKININYVKP